MKNYTKQTFSVYWQQMKGKRYLFFLSVFFISTGAVIDVIVPLYFKKIFDVIAQGSLSDSAYKVLISILITLAILEFFRWSCWRVATFLVVNFQSRVMIKIANFCFAYLHKHSFNFFNNSFTGSLVKRVNYFVNAFENLTDILFWNFISLLVGLVVIIFVLMSKSYILGFGIIIWMLLMLVLNYFFAKYKFKYDVKTNKAESESSGYLADTITNHSNVKLFNGYQREVEGYGAVNEKVRKCLLFSLNLENYFEAIQTLFMAVLNIGFFYVAIRLWKDGRFTVGDFALLQSYITMVIMRVWNFSHMIRRVYRSFSDAEEMTTILEKPQEIQDVRGAKDLKIKKADIEFKDVDFCYYETRQIFKKFNLKIKDKERLALIGPSGAGKSTIIKLILRNHEISDGEITINKQNIARVTQESLWKNISMVPQDPILFHRTLMENIRYGRPDASEKEVFEAARKAHCHEFISEFPEGYDTYVGERGVKLSGGERQRVAIARAILKNSPILILDEATSSLDSNSERLIQDALENLMKGKTVIVIAHRLSTIRKMDRIVFVDEGEVKEQGTHDELTKKIDGRYKKLWQLQAGGFIK